MSPNSNSDVEEAEKSRVTSRVKRFERRVGGTGRGTRNNGHRYRIRNETKRETFRYVFVLRLIRPSGLYSRENNVAAPLRFREYEDHFTGDTRTSTDAEIRIRNRIEEIYVPRYTEEIERHDSPASRTSPVRSSSRYISRFDPRTTRE